MNPTRKTMKNKIVSHVSELTQAINILFNAVNQLDARIAKLENPEGIQTTPSGIIYTESK